MPVVSQTRRVIRYVEYESIVSDFAKRTRINLETLRAVQQEGRQVYEVTALVNSLLGLLVFPQQQFMDRIPETPLGELQARGWPVPRILGSFDQAATLRELARYLRNAVAHFNLKFRVDGSGQIDGVILWNNRKERKVWEVEMNLDELEGIVDRFVALLEDRGVMRPVDGSPNVQAADQAG
jgi:hypothetical protein